MAITPINNISFNNSITFEARRNQKEINTHNSTTQSKSNMMINIPVAVLMTLSPSLLNAQEPKIEQKYTTENIFDDTPKATNDKPFYLSPQYVTYSEDFKMDNKNYTIYYTDIGRNSVRDEFSVSEVFVIPEDFKLIKHNGYNCNGPAQVTEIVLHETDNQSNNFLTVITTERTCDDSGKTCGSTIREMMLPAEIMEDLLNLYIGESEYGLYPEAIQFRTVKTNEIMEPKFQPLIPAPFNK